MCNLSPCNHLPPPKPYLESSATSTSTLAVIGAFDCPAVGSSVFSSPFVELTTCTKNTEQKEEKSISPNDTITDKLYFKFHSKTYFQPVLFVNILNLTFATLVHDVLGALFILPGELFRTNSNNLRGICKIAMLIESTPETVKILCIFYQDFLILLSPVLHTKCHTDTQIYVYQLHVLIKKTCLSSPITRTELGETHRCPGKKVKEMRYPLENDYGQPLLNKRGN